MNDITQKLKLLDEITSKPLPKDIPQGDMPTDKVDIVDEVVIKANILLPYLTRKITPILSSKDKIVVGIAGGSGVGKTCIASIFSYYFNQVGIGAYTLSGDNYPNRIPEYNDAERRHLYIDAGIKALSTTAYYTNETREILKKLIDEEKDDNPELEKQYPFFSVYHEGGQAGLKNYLGTEKEINFEAISEVLRLFKEGAPSLNLKRMGDTESSIYYDQLDFSNIHILFVEWTHALNESLKNVDIRILLNSTPEETLERRIKRNRNKGADSPFISTVLSLEQRKLHSQAMNADLIMTSSNQMIDYLTYKEIMKELDD